jgi:hypothetical protein
MKPMVRRKSLTDVLGAPQGTKPATPAPRTRGTGRGRRKAAQAPEPVDRAAPVAAEDGDGVESFDERVNLPLDAKRFTDLGMAKLHDRIDTTIRLRAMIDLWTSDPRIRAKVDARARQLKARDGRSIKRR